MPHMLWRYMSASLIHAIWCAHLRRMDSDPIKSTAEMAIMMTRLEAGMRNLTRLAEAQAGDSDGHTAAAVLKAYVDCFLSQTDAIPLTPMILAAFTCCFSMVDHAAIQDQEGLDPLSMAYSRKDTTNNFAEYWGLIHGLREAQRSHFEPFECIGPSTAPIGTFIPDKSTTRGLHRHPRMVPSLPCLQQDGGLSRQPSFMDTRTSTQVHFPTQRAAFNNLTQDLDNDVMHWLMRSSDDPRRMDIIKDEAVRRRRLAQQRWTNLREHQLVARTLIRIARDVAEQQDTTMHRDVIDRCLGNLATDGLKDQVNAVRVLQSTGNFEGNRCRDTTTN
ncbi:hypothetical protein FI667_g2737, partial [Globisporangium splendens]